MRDVRSKAQSRSIAASRSRARRAVDRMSWYPAEYVSPSWGVASPARTGSAAHLIQLIGRGREGRVRGPPLQRMRSRVAQRSHGGEAVLPSVRRLPQLKAGGAPERVGSHCRRACGGAQGSLDRSESQTTSQKTAGRGASKAAPSSYSISRAGTSAPGEAAKAAARARSGRASRGRSSDPGAIGFPTQKTLALRPQQNCECASMNGEAIFMPGQKPFPRLPARARQPGAGGTRTRPGGLLHDGTTL